MVVYTLRKWGSKSKIYDWTANSLNISGVHKDTVTDGFIKNFYRGSRIIVFRKSDIWNVHFNDIEVPLSDLLNLKVKSKGIICHLSFQYDDVIYSFFDIVPWDFISRALDPTHDYMDRLEVFSYWLFDKYQAGNKVID